MSNIIPANITVPTHLANRVGSPSALAASLTGGLGSGGEGFPRISIKGARFRLVDGDSETVLDSTTLSAVIVGANPRVSKTWYAKAWTPDAEPSSPDCQSMDGISPDPASAQPQNDLCATCPQNAWGSKVTTAGQQIKACSDSKRLAIVASEDPTGPVYLLTVTPAALKGLNQYQKELAVRGIPPEIVKTSITFDTDASFPKLQFGFGGFLDPDTQAVVDELFGAARVKEITGESAHAPTAVPQIAAPVVPKPAVVKPVVQEAPAPAPAPAVPKRGFGASKPATPKAAAPKAAPVTAPEKSASTLADEIAALVGGMTDD
jgi:hypothetical protein